VVARADPGGPAGAHGTAPPKARSPAHRATRHFLLPAFPGLIVKDSYWRWPERDRAGNAIDFFVQVLGLSFHDAMRQITSGP